MLKKLELWRKRALQNNFNHFPTLYAFIESSDEVFPQDTKDIIIEHLQILKHSFRKYFPVPDKNKNWVVDLRPLMIFSTTYLCEKGFSAYVYTKNKYRNRLNIESDLRIQLSNIDPKIPDLVLKKQHHPSH
ncbi:unnamed protein product [Macrosiphum euphorbiae]|nr:unnamed protein product [Macrosiphum euphorbiae]CAI6372515.1 unnamed protein product [Macrosiphum euphorbiae]